MKYWVRALLGLTICGASIVAIDWGLYHLMLTGSCASGGPYVSARPCPPGTGGQILAVIGGVFGGLIGVGVFATRGRSGERRESPYPLALLMWTLLFCTIGLSGLYATLGPAARDDAPKGTAIFLAALFIPMGLAPAPFARLGRRRGERATALVQHGKRCGGTVVSVDDTNWTVNDNPGDPQNKNAITFDQVSEAPTPTAPSASERINLATATPTAEEASEIAEVEAESDPITKIERLDKLREKGLITEAEFQMQKQRLLREV